MKGRIKSRLAQLEAVRPAPPTAVADISPEDAAISYRGLMSQSGDDAASREWGALIPNDAVAASRVYQQMINATPQQWAAMVRARHESKP